MIGELTNHLWQSTLFAVAAGLLTVAFRKNRAQVRYWLWFSASFKFFVPFTLLMGLGSHLEWAPAAKQIATPAVMSAMEQIAQPFPETRPFVPSTPGATDWKPVAMLGVWACGLAAIALVRFRDWLRIRDAVRASTPFDLAVPVEVRSSPGLLEPGVVGWLRPILLLPAGIAERLTPPQLQAVLAHELCHVRRRDNLFAGIHMIVEATFWFHPLVWWIGARLVEERERACDEQVLSLGSEPRVYAEGIVNVCKLYAESPLACVSGVTGSNLKKRIEAIMTNRIALRLTFAKKAALAVASIAALAVPIVVGMMHIPAILAQSATAPTPKFEVASIKPCKPGDLGAGDGRKSIAKTGRGGRDSSPGRLSTGCDTVESLIRYAYVLYASGSLLRDPSTPPVEGGPAWIRSGSYHINARAEGSPSEGMMMGPMLRALLEDRFQLKIRRETREVPVYALTVAKGGPRLPPFQEGSCIPRDMPFRPLSPEERGQKNCLAFIREKGPNFAVEATGTNLDSLFKLLYLVLDRPVINRTGIKGRFDISMEFARPEGRAVFRPVGEPVSPHARPADPSDDLAGPSIFSVLEKQFGLKLEPAKGPRDFLVIDHVERPSGN